MIKKRFVVEFDMYDTHGTKLSHKSEDDVYAETPAKAILLVKQQYDPKGPRREYWGHIRTKNYKCKPHQHQPKLIINPNPLFRIEYSAKIPTGRISNTGSEIYNNVSSSTKVRAKNATEARQHVLNYWKDANTKASVKILKIGKIKE
jgi:hypothetical protein